MCSKVRFRRLADVCIDDDDQQPHISSACAFVFSRITDKTARGLIHGGTSNVLGAATAAAAASSDQPLTRDMATVAMILTGTAGAVLMSIPPVRSAILSVALGSSVATSPVPFSAAEARRWQRDPDKSYREY